MNLLGSIQFVDSVADFGTSPELSGAYDTATATINGQTYVYVTGNSDAGIQVLTIDDTGALEPLTSTPDTAELGLDSVFNLQVVERPNESFLITSSANDAISVFRIDDDGNRTDGHLVPLATYRNFPGAGSPDAGAGVLDFPEGISTVEIDGRDFLLVGAYNSDAVSVYRVQNNGDLVRTDVKTDADDPDFFLDGAREPVPYTIGGRTFVYVGSDLNNGISVFELSASGELDFVEAVSGSGDAYQMVAMDFNGTDYLFVADNSGDRLQAYAIARNGELTFVAETPQFVDGTFSDIFSLEEVVIDGVPFLAAGAENQDTFFLLSLDENEEFEIVERFADSTELNGLRGFSFYQVNDKTFAIGAAQQAARVTVLEIGALDDPITGTSSADRIVGQGGDDDILGLGGNDELIGGGGDDVLSGRGGKDDLSGGAGEDVLIGGAGNDTLDGGGGADILIGGAGTDTAVFRVVDDGISVSLSGSGSGGTDSFFSIENIVGSRFDDTIQGDDGDNVLAGGNGDDLVSGEGGVDKITGGSGNDTLRGDDGRDNLNGGAGRDVLDGGNGNDKLTGGAGGDELNGGVGNNRLNGGGGNDVLISETGNDTMNGGGGSDRFVFAPDNGNDEIANFSPRDDVIDLSAFDDPEGIFASAITVAGNAILVTGGGDNSIVIAGIRANQLGEENFDFG